MQHNPHARGAVWFGSLAVVVATLLVWSDHGHAETPPDRYVITTEGTIAGGTVFDTVTNLTWQREPPLVPQTWAGAESHCSTLGEGWRIPSFKELATLVVVSSVPFSGQLVQEYYSDGDGGQRQVSGSFWAAPASAETAYVVEGNAMSGANIGIVDPAEATYVRVRCVHTGKP